MTKWLILRTASRNTLKLAEQLMREGFDAWTPQRTFRKRAPRCRQVYEVTAPILPTFAFVRADHVNSVLALAKDPRKPCADFSVFHLHDEPGIVEDAELNGLRKVEERERARLEAQRRAGRRRQVVFNEGEEIKVTVGPFAGMSGTVTNDDGKFVTLLFSASREVKFPSFVLTGNEVICPSEQAAKAA